MPVVEIPKHTHIAWTTESETSFHIHCEVTDACFVGVQGSQHFSIKSEDMDLIA